MKCNEKRGYFKRKIASFSILRVNNDKNELLVYITDRLIHYLRSTDMTRTVISQRLSIRSKTVL